MKKITVAILVLVQSFVSYGQVPALVDPDATIPYSFFRSFYPARLSGQSIEIYVDNTQKTKRGSIYFIQPYFLPDLISFKEQLDRQCGEQTTGPVSISLPIEFSSREVDAEIAAADRSLRLDSTEEFDRITMERVISFPYSDITVYVGGGSSGTTERIAARWPPQSTSDEARVASTQTPKSLVGKVAGTCAELKDILATSDMRAQVRIKTTKTRTSYFGVNLRHFVSSDAYQSLFTEASQTGSIRTTSSSRGGGIGINLKVVKLGFGGGSTSGEVVDTRHRAISGNLVDSIVQNYLTNLSATCDASSNTWCNDQIAGPLLKSFLASEIPKLGSITVKPDGSAEVFLGEFKGALSPQDVNEALQANSKLGLKTEDERKAEYNGISGQMKDVLSLADERGINWQQTTDGKWIPKSVSLYVIDRDELTRKANVSYNEVVRESTQTAILDLPAIVPRIVTPTEREKIIGEANWKMIVGSAQPQKRFSPLGSLGAPPTNQMHPFYLALTGPYTICVKSVNGEPSLVEAWNGPSTNIALDCRPNYKPDKNSVGCRVSRDWWDWYMVQRRSAGFALIHQDICSEYFGPTREDLKDRPEIPPPLKSVPSRN